jgi:hypothetical protein
MYLYGNKDIGKLKIRVNFASEGDQCDKPTLPLRQEVLGEDCQEGRKVWD